MHSSRIAVDSEAVCDKAKCRGFSLQSCLIIDGNTQESIPRGKMVESVRIFAWCLVLRKLSLIYLHIFYLVT